MLPELWPAIGDRANEAALPGHSDLHGECVIKRVARPLRDALRGCIAHSLRAVPYDRCASTVRPRAHKGFMRTESDESQSLESIVGANSRRVGFPPGHRRRAGTRPCHRAGSGCLARCAGLMNSGPKDAISPSLGRAGLAIGRVAQNDQSASADGADSDRACRQLGVMASGARSVPP